MRSTIRNEFDQGRALLYVFAVTPLSLLIALFLPTSLYPFIMAFFLFPPFFYYVRRQKFIQTFGVLLLWSALQFGVVTALASLFPGFIEERTGTWAAGSLWEIHAHEGLAKIAAVSGLDLLFDVILAGVSGGVLTLVAGVIEINSVAIATAKIFGSSGLSAAFLSIKPWAIANGMGRAMTVIAVSSVFYAKLEKRKPEWTPVIRWLVLGLTFVALGVYLEIMISQTWNTALDAVSAVAD